MPPKAAAMNPALRSANVLLRRACCVPFQALNSKAARVGYKPSQRACAAPLPSWSSRSPRPLSCLAAAAPVLSQSQTRQASTSSGASQHQQQSAAAAPSPRGNSAAPSFQEAIRKLQEYWAAAGCLVWLPHNTEVGAGTMNPATFLRVLGPEPWNVAYPEPSVRPDDSRYGDNPNRVQRHTQFQVILKPDPGNPQELYLGSLEALGIDTKAHDIRFVEDNWESPVLGAWGLGWEVWLDGMEVTQFTYFQQAGGKQLEVPAVEITYGLERILMALQGVQHFKDIRYNDNVTYGELFLQNEYEMSRYNLDDADVEEQRQRFALYDQEARRMLAKRLPIPAYDHLLKLSHTFNILDARGAVGVTERANCFATMRALAREVTTLWAERRAELEHPLGIVPPPALPEPHSSQDGSRSSAGAASSGAQMFVLEIGSEELPPDDVVAGMEQLRQRVPELLQRLRLSHGAVTVEGTPRRLAVIVDSLAAAQPAKESRVRGPPAKAAFSTDGKPTKALEGFCRKAGVSVEAVTVEADPKAKNVEYVFVTVQDKARPAVEVLSQELPSLIGSLSFTKSMRWRGDAAYSRPMRWVLALMGDALVPFVYGGLASGNTTRVLRNAASPELRVASAAQYVELLREARITLSLDQRSEDIWQRVQRSAGEAGGVIPDSARTDLLPEVANLVESPTVVRGSFSRDFLQLPPEVLVMVMRKHQRYFPVFEAATASAAPSNGGSSQHQQALLPAFVTVANGPVDAATVAAGNEAVLRARFEDAAFFYREDLKQPLAALRPKLAGTVFQKDLGTLLDKSDRTERLVRPLAEAAGLTDAADVAAQAANLSRADLASSTVMEMTALAGTMGRHYAQVQGLPEAVSEAIFESVLPRQAGDILPATPAGILVAVADRLDSLVGLTAAVGVPSATADPYGFRRAAYGLLQTLLSNGVRMSLRRAIAAAAELQPIAVSDAARRDVQEFITRRLEQLLIEQDVQPEAVRAVLAERGDDAALAATSAKELQEELAKGEGSPLRRIMNALSRPTRIVRGKQLDASWQVAEAKFEQQEERQLFRAYQEVAQKLSPTMSINEFLTACEALVTPIDAYFEKVFVMSEDEAVRQNRLACMRCLADLSKGIVDLTQLPGF